MDFKASYIDGSVTSSGDGSLFKPWKTLNDAIENCKNNENILINSGTYKGADNIGLIIEKNFNLYGDGEVIFDAQGKNFIWRLFDVAVNIDGIIFKNGNADRGGAIYSSEESYITINNSKFINNTAEYYGGAILTDGHLELNNCYFNKNTQTTPDDNHDMLCLMVVGSCYRYISFEHGICQKQCF